MAWKISKEAAASSTRMVYMLTGTTAAIALGFSKLLASVSPVGSLSTYLYSGLFGLKGESKGGP